MLILLSPAKRMASSPLQVVDHTVPVFEKEMKSLLRVLKKKQTSELMQLMGISQKLAELNFQRYQQFKIPYDAADSSSALYSFKGDAYLGLDAKTFDSDDLNYIQRHLRIISGFYGLLRPLDLILPYRLEMGIKLPVGKHNNLYQFWGNKIAKRINKELESIESNTVINLASKEYFKAINPNKINAEVLHVNFKEFRDGQYKFISFFGKKARGMMTRYMTKNKLTVPEELKGFDYEGYAYNPNISSKNEWLFTRSS